MILKIDLEIWATQTDFATRNGLKLGTVSQWVLREQARPGSTKIDLWPIPALNGLTLVKWKN